MKKIIALILMLNMSLLALSSDDLASAGFNDLTDQQKAELIKNVADQADMAKATPVDTADQAQKWVDLGASIGKGLASSAKELGVAVNDFAKTDVGKWTMFLIVFNIIGGALIHIVGGLFFAIVGCTFVTYMINRRYGWTIRYDKDTGKRILKEREEMRSDDTFGFAIFYILILLISIIIMFTY